MRKIESVNSAKCFVISAPSGAGKTTLERRLLADKPDVFYNSVSDTTRRKRSDEIDGRDYNFISVAEFKSKVDINQGLQKTIDWITQPKYLKTYKSEIYNV